MRIHAIIVLIVAAAGLSACFDAAPDLDKTRFACQTDADCLDRYVCRSHVDGRYCTPYTEAGGDTAGPSTDTETSDTPAG